MELLAVIHHPGTSIRPVEQIAAELGGVYDRVMGGVSKRRYAALRHASVLLLEWPGVRLNWSNWHEDERGTLATAGLPLLYCPPGRAGCALGPGQLADMLGGDPADTAALAHCGGYFAAAHVATRPAGNPADREGPVRLMTNYLAEVPLYRAGGAGVTVWSNKAAAAAMLAGLKPELDERGAAEFLLLGHCLEDRTLWRGVETEPPGMLITLDPAHDTPQRQSCFDFPRYYFAHRLPLQEAARQIVADMRPLIDALRRSDREVRLHLSGGLDSRAVAAILRHYDFKPLCLTHNTPNEEVPSAKRLTRRLGLPYRLVPTAFPTAETFETGVDPSLWQSDGLMSLKYLGVQYDLAFIRRESYLPVEGYGGEHGRAYYYGDADGMAKLGGGDYGKLYHKTLGMRGDLLRRPDLERTIRDTIASFIRRGEQAGLDPYQVSTLFYLNQRMRRWAAGRRNTGWQWIVDPLQMPCWTYRAVSADPTDQFGDGLIRAVIEAAWPDTARVPTVKELAYRARRRRVASNRIVRSAYKLLDRFRNPYPPSPHNEGLRRLRGRLLDSIRAAEPMIGGLVTADIAQSWLVREPWNYDQTELFWNAATLARWCRLFLGTTPPVRPARC